MKKINTDGTFKENKNLSIHRWYPYVEGFSEQFVLDCLKYNKDAKIIYDPFNGSGTTSTTCALNGIECYASEVNPFMQFVAETKIKTVKKILINNKIDTIQDELKKFTISDKTLYKNNCINNCYKNFDFFSEKNLEQINIIKNYTNNIEDEDIKNIFKMALASIITKVSKMIRNTDLRKRTEKELENVPEDVYNEFKKSLENMLEDIKLVSNSTNGGKDIKEFKFISNNAKKIDKKYNGKVDMIITSPPYINGTNYFRNTKLELWILDYIFCDNDSKKYRLEAITAGINNVTKDIIIKNSRKIVKDIAKKICKKSPDKRISKMIEAYFSDMEIVFKNFGNILKKEGYIFFDIGDSQYYNVYVPVYDIIKEIGNENNLKITEEIELRKRISKNGMKLTQKLLIFRKEF